MSSSELENARRLALALPKPERARLAATLLASIDDPSNPGLEAAWAAELLAGLEDLLDDQSDAEWAAEIKRRLAEIEAGTAELIDVDVVIAELRRESRIR